MKEVIYVSDIYVELFKSKLLGIMVLCLFSFVVPEIIIFTITFGQEVITDANSIMTCSRQ